MERILTIACLVLSAAGLAYLKTNQLEKMEADRLAAAEADSIAAAQAAMAKAEAAKFHFMIPHDSDAASDSIRIIMTGEQSGDPDNDAIKFYWEQVSGDYLMLDSDTNSATSFSAVNGEYAFRLTVTDSYGSSASDEATVKIHAESNAPPQAVINVTARE